MLFILLPAYSTCRVNPAMAGVEVGGPGLTPPRVGLSITQVGEGGRVRVHPATGRPRDTAGGAGLWVNPKHHPFGWYIYYYTRYSIYQ